MSCGDPHDTDCREVLDRLYAYLDQEVAELDCTKIREHLDECAPCLREYDLDATMKALIKRSCSSEAAPQDLRTKILTTLKAACQQPQS
jgi:mycothiol system anti-sigma-R factor